MSLDYRNYRTKPIVGDVSKAQVLKYDRLVGVEFEAIFNDFNNVSIPSECGVSNDASLPSSAGREIQTPPASADALEKLIFKVCNELNGKNNKAFANQYCGLHIHLDGKNFSDSQRNTIRLTNTYYVLEPIIWAMLPQSRRSNKYTLPLYSRITEQDYKQLLRVQDRKDIYYLHKKWYKSDNTVYFQDMKGMPKSGPRRHGFNLSALLAADHLELRYHPGTLNHDKVRNWIWMHLHIMDWVLKGYSKGKVENIRKAKTLEDKMVLFFKEFAIPEKLQMYIRFRVELCQSPAYIEENDDRIYSDSLIS